MSKFRAERAAFICLLAGVAHADGFDVRDFARTPDFTHATLAPDGERVSYVDEVDGRQVVFVRSVGRGSASSTLSVQPPREGVRWCGWADSRYLLCGTATIARKQHALVEGSKLYSIDSKTRAVRELNSRFPIGARDQVIDLMPFRPELVLLQIDADGRGFPEVVELNVASGKSRTLVRAHAPVRSWMSDGKGTVRLGLGYDGLVATLFARNSTDETWKPSLVQSLSDPDAIGPLAFGAIESELLALKHHRGRTALFRADPANPAASVLLFADPLYDIAGPLALHPATRELLAVRYLAQSPAIHVFDERERKLYEWIDDELPGTNDIKARTLDDARLLIHSSSDTDPPSLYIADVKNRHIDLLGHQYPELESRVLAPMRSLMYAARDGQRIPAYLTTPREHVAPGPAIVLPHGGPETRDVREFDPLVQFLAAHGYAVLQMNFRGSQGYGAGFAAAGARQWGGVMHNDITDGAQWLIAGGIADPQRICIVGASFGGYAALLGATKQSQWYACAASYAGPSDLMAFAQYTQRLPDSEMWRERLGSDSRALWQMSPLAHAWGTETAILLMHGRHDPVVPISQSTRFARELKRLGKPHRLIERADCDHDLILESCRLVMFEELRRFLVTHLSEPLP